MSEQGTAEHMEMPKHGEICWTELSTSDLEAAKSFYSALFGWEYKESDSTEMEYTEIHLGGEKQFGGMYKKPPEMSEVPSHWMSYISVDDIDDSLQKATENGGTVVVPATDIPGTGRFGMITDPTGATIAMITLKF
ncbi:MAG: VOC family protein [Pyrinomonadaceae bacterium]|nr:VOC family protein [Pyrinomonadaceae bacterium]